MIYDICSYFNERDVLEVRMGELARVGDILHIVIESRTTFAGHPRLLDLDDGVYYDVRGHERLIRYVVDAEGTTPWEREAAQRDAGLNFLRSLGAKTDDIVLFGDVDEIPYASCVKEMAEEVGDQVASLRMPYHSLLATLRRPNSPWEHQWPVLAKVSTVREFGSLQAMREHSEQYTLITRNGWHLSSMGGPDIVLPKIAAFSHAGEAWQVGLNADRLKELALLGRDICDRFTQETVPLEHLPATIQADPDRYTKLLSVEKW